MELFHKRLHLYQRIIIIIIAIFAVLEDALILIATWRERRRHQTNKNFFACLAVTDLLVGLLVEPLNVYRLYLNKKSRETISNHLCRFMVWIDVFAASLTASIYALTIISIDIINTTVVS